MTDEEQKAKVVRELADKIGKEWADRGKIVEGGWQVYATLYLQGADPKKNRELRRLWFLSAQHLFASMIGFMDADREPTPLDLDRMTKLHDELEAFRRGTMT